MRWIIVALLMAALTGCSSVVSTRPFGLAPLDLTEQADKWTGTWQSSMGICALTVESATNGILAMTFTSQKGWWRWSNETHRIYLRTGGEWTYASLEDIEDTNGCYLWGKIANEDGTILWWLPDSDKFKDLVESGALPGTVEQTAKKKNEPSVFPIVGYTSSGEAIYQHTSPSGTPIENFTRELEAPTAEPESAKDEIKSAASELPREAGSGEPANTNTTPSLGYTFGYTITLGDLEPKHYELICAASNGVMFDWDRPLVMVRQSRRADMRYLRSAEKRWIHEQGK